MTTYDCPDCGRSFKRMADYLWHVGMRNRAGGTET